MSVVPYVFEQSTYIALPRCFATVHLLVHLQVNFFVCFIVTLITGELVNAQMPPLNMDEKRVLGTKGFGAVLASCLLDLIV